MKYLFFWSDFGLMLVWCLRLPGSTDSRLGSFSFEFLRESSRILLRGRNRISKECGTCDRESVTSFATRGAVFGRSQPRHEATQKVEAKQQTSLGRGPTGSWCHH